MQGFIVLFITRIWQFAAINLATLGLILLGLGIFGLTPSLIACLWATSRLSEQTLSELFSGMWREYRREFVNANISALPFLLASTLLGGLALNSGGLIGGILLAIAGLSLMHFLAAIIIISRMKMSVLDTLVNTRMVMLLAGFRLAFILFLIPILVFVAIWQPLAFLYFGLSVWSFAFNALVLPPLEAHIPNSPKSNQQEALI